MPRGYGRGYGLRGAYGRWYPGWQTVAQYPPTQLTVEEQKGAVYVGPCRCGFGPHAYYRLSDGRIVHASSVPPALPVLPEDAASELDRLRSENEELRRRMKDLEQKLEKR
jgi:hypothetical protein